MKTIVARLVVTVVLIYVIFKHAHWSVGLFAVLMAAFSELVGIALSGAMRRCPTCGSTKRNVRLVYYGPLVEQMPSPYTCYNEWHNPEEELDNDLDDLERDIEEYCPVCGASEEECQCGRIWP